MPALNADPWLLNFRCTRRFAFHDIWRKDHALVFFCSISAGILPAKVPMGGENSTKGPSLTPFDHAFHLGHWIGFCANTLNIFLVLCITVIVPPHLVVLCFPSSLRSKYGT